MCENHTMDKSLLGARIVEARKAAGLTQQQLADSLSVDRTAVARLEAGARKLDVTELLAIASTLDMPLAFFVSDESETVISRRHDAATDPDSTWAMDAALRLFSNDIRDLQARGLLDSPEPLPEMRTPRTTEEAEHCADVIRGIAGLSAEPVPDLGRVCERLGLLTFVGGFEDSDGSFVSVDGSSPPLGAAVLNGGSRSGRRRMTLAHELGHWVFGDAYDHGSRWDETMVFAFAIHLLAPRSAVTRVWHAHRALTRRERALHIGSTFRLSWTAVANQLLNLGLVSDLERAELTRTTPRRGEFLRLGLEIDDELSPPYVSPGFAAAVLAGYEARTLTPERTMELLRGTLSPDDLPEQQPEALTDLSRSFAGHGG